MRDTNKNATPPENSVWSRRENGSGRLEGRTLAKPAKSGKPKTEIPGALMQYYSEEPARNRRAQTLGRAAASKNQKRI